MTKGASVTFGEARVELACFELAGQLFGVDVLQIREIVRAQTVTPLPRAPKLIEGVIDLRGAVIPVIDLGQVLRGEGSSAGSRSRIAIVEVEGLVFGLRVDAVVDVLAVEPANITEPPALATQAGYDAVRAVVRRSGSSPVLILSLEHVLETVYRSGLPAEGAPA